MKALPRGSVLFAILVLISMMAMVATGVMFRMRAQVYAASVSASSSQARLAAMSGLQQAMAVLCDNGDDAAWWDNPDAFRDQLVADDGGVRWCFTVYAPRFESGQTSVRYGLIDESAKINVNTATAEALARLPGMNAAMADAIIDYRDGDDQAAPQGAERDYYSRLPSPYSPRNGPLATLEELLLVRGFNAAVVFGEDGNHNGLLDAGENDGDKSFPPDNGDGHLDAGLSAVLTASTYERDSSDPNRPKFNINGDLKGLARTQLPPQAQQYIRTYREDGNFFENIYELLDASYPPRGGSPIVSGVSIQQMERLEKTMTVGAISREIVPADDDTADDPNAPGDDPNNPATGRGSRRVPPARRPPPAGRRGERPPAAQPPSQDANDPNDSPQEESQGPPVPGRLNINTAPVEVLCLLPGVDTNLAERIVQARSTLDDGQMTSRTWIYSQKLVDAQTFKKLAPMITTSSRQYRVRCVGYGISAQGGRGAGYCVLEAVVDVSGRAPRIVYLRDLTRLGMPLAVASSST